MFKILSAPTATQLEELIKEYEVTSLGSLLIHNDHYFQSIMYKPKVTTTKKPTSTKPKATTKVTPSKPRTTQKKTKE